MAAPPLEQLIARLQSHRWGYSSATFETIPVGEILQRLASIEDRDTRARAQELFGKLMACATVMKLDPENYARVVERAFEELIECLVTATKPCRRARRRGPQRQTVTLI